MLGPVRNIVLECSPWRLLKAVGVGETTGEKSGGGFVAWQLVEPTLWLIGLYLPFTFAVGEWL